MNSTAIAEAEAVLGLAERNILRIGRIAYHRVATIDAALKGIDEQIATAIVESIGTGSRTRIDRLHEKRAETKLLAEEAQLAQLEIRKYYLQVMKKRNFLREKKWDFVQGAPAEWWPSFLTSEVNLAEPSGIDDQEVLSWINRSDGKAYQGWVRDAG